MTSPHLTKCLQHTEERLKKTETRIRCATVSSDDLSFTDYDAGDTGGNDGNDDSKEGAGANSSRKEAWTAWVCSSANRPEKRS